MNPHWSQRDRRVSGLPAGVPTYRVRKWGSRWFVVEAKRSTSGVPDHLQILAKQVGARDQSIVLVEPLERASAHELSTPARW